MALDIDTFSNVSGGFSFFKAVGHPLAAPRIRALLDGLAQPVAVYDPTGHGAAFASLHDMTDLNCAGVFVQDLEAIGASALGQTAQPITALPESGARSVLVLAFDADRLVEHIQHLLPDDAAVVSLNAARLDASMLTNPRRYLDPINFATNFAFFRDTDTDHTRLVTANYWSGYGAQDTRIWFRLFDDAGETLAEWTQELSPTVATITIDSREVRDRFGLPAFTGQLFLHVVNGAGHDVVKYALDTYGDTDSVLSCTHDANAWPADLYAGLPAPNDGEQVLLWVQNSHPCAIPAGAIALNPMGQNDGAALDRDIPPFGSFALDVSDLLPDLRWPAQVEIHAGKHFVRPRYEVTTKAGRRRISHPNVQRTDLKPDPGVPEIANLLGKGYVLPAPILPVSRFRTEVLPTPMSTAQNSLPVAAAAYGSDGTKIAEHRFGNLPRDHRSALDIDTLLNESARAALSGGYGHVELLYDFADGGTADGWLHGLFRYEDRASGHGADTSFGAHIFNTVLTYRNEPQSYSGPAPGLSTRLFLRLGKAPLDTMCHLIYPASTPWHERSDTHLLLFDGDGTEIADHKVEIPCGGSQYWCYGQTFDEAERCAAGDDAYVIIRDQTCRLFGYHGLLHGTESFSLDHMFGF
ncbi:MAG: hypothetical protein GKS00_04410 [Alphaproteobacteria bacterium]|nr:hypothetical protein [Alphaproteobacteria bacterium]